MARQRDPRRIVIMKKWLESNGKTLLKDLAEEFNCSASQVRRWKSQDKWSDLLNSNVTNDKSNVTNKGGAPPGNKNAKGNRGNQKAAPPANNKNAVVTGEHESIFLEFMTDDEKDLYRIITTDPFLVLNEEVKMLRFRQTRMLRRVQEAELGLNEDEREVLKELRGRKKIIGSKRGKAQVNIDELVTTEIKEISTRKIDDILRIEEALTRVSNQLTKSIKQLNDLLVSKTRLELMEAQINYTRAQTAKVSSNKYGDDHDRGTVINIIDDI